MLFYLNTKRRPIGQLTYSSRGWYLCQNILLIDILLSSFREIHQKMEELQKAYNYESIKRTRLTFDKEELQYTLKQRSEQLQAAEAKLFEISQDSSLLASHGRCSSGRSTLDISGTGTNSSPTSPIMKGMIERNDSVSWTLEIEDEASKGGASKIVRRSGSLRSNNEQPRFALIQRRQTSGTNGHSNGLANNGGNPLSQSMSATALQRGEQDGRPLSRTRSHSMCIKASSTTCESPQRKNRSRQSEELNLSDWNETREAGQPMCSSSPKQSNAEMHPRSSTMKLMTSEVKKFQEIQESAGEAMVSGANSEDESCSASSEDMMRSSSASSTASVGSLTKRPKPPPSRMSIEEALPCCTPMEVSWSEDAADAAASGLAWHGGSFEDGAQAVEQIAEAAEEAYELEEYVYGDQFLEVDEDELVVGEEEQEEEEDVPPENSDSDDSF